MIAGQSLKHFEAGCSLEYGQSSFRLVVKTRETLDTVAFGECLRIFIFVTEYHLGPVMRF